MDSGQPLNALDPLEAALVRAGKSIVYPATPDLAARVRSSLEAQAAPRRAWIPPRSLRPAYVIAAALLLAFLVLLAVPTTREAIAQLLGLRTVRIIPVTPTPTSPIATPGASASAQPATLPTSTLIAPTAHQCCESSLADAQSKARFKILLPPAPPPSRVYLQDLAQFGNAQQVILVFGDPVSPVFTLYEAQGYLYAKLVSGGTKIQEVQVKGQRALWLTGAPHLLVRLDASGHPQPDSERSITTNTLAWESADVTYRLETSLSLTESVAFAESLR